MGLSHGTFLLSQNISPDKKISGVDLAVFNALDVD
jgi:hypothetical protein